MVISDTTFVSRRNPLICRPNQRHPNLRTEFHDGTHRCGRGFRGWSPRGIFSMSHWPRGIGSGDRSCHTRSGTTTKGLRMPMRCGPSSSARRRISDSRALASATVHTLRGPETAMVHLSREGSIWSILDYACSSCKTTRHSEAACSRPPSTAHASVGRRLGLLGPSQRSRCLHDLSLLSSVTLTLPSLDDQLR